MIAEFESQTIAALHFLFDQFGWFGLAGLMAFENATSPTPSEIPLGLSSWMFFDTYDAPPAMVLIGGLYVGLGSLAGSSITYWMVRHGGPPLLVQITRRISI